MPSAEDLQLFDSLINEAYGVLASKFFSKYDDDLGVVSVSIGTIFLHQLGGEDGLRRTLDKVAADRGVSAPRFAVRKRQFDKESEELCVEAESVLRQLGLEPKGVASEFSKNGDSIKITVAFLSQLPEEVLSQSHESLRRIGSRVADGVNVRFVFLESDPPPLRILHVIKILQPVEVADIQEQLIAAGYASTSKKLANALDKLRKQGMVVLDARHRVSLSIEGLSAVPVSRDRASSDILRALYLGKRFK